ncbi:MAG: 8-amino-7-oxononanoate synthase [Acidimicrobiia bacterium]|nr:8-amino-7-oxononanoate synthase [Acidimicrobiia bacterium]
MTATGAAGGDGSEAWAAEQIAAIRAAGRWREVRTFDARGPVGRLGGREVVSFASNDYLGLSFHPAVIAAAHAALDRWGAGATASRLIVGSRPVHAELEAELSDWKQTERALLFPTGYAANLGVLAGLGGPDCLIVSDELNHASIIDGCRLSRSPVAVARHNDVDHVDRLLGTASVPRKMVVVDAVFSMDGDEADIAALGERCARHGALLVIDEAHAVLGPSPAPLAGVEHLQVLRVVTLSKALGTVGGAVCGSAPFIDLLVNRARPFIFTTGPAPADAAAALEAIRITRGPEGDALVARLRRFVDRLRPGHRSPIIPIVVGSEALALQAAEGLLAEGFLVPAIRPPTVPPGTSRLRIALSAAHSEDILDRLRGALAALGLRP